MATMTSMNLIKPVGDTSVAYTSTYSKYEYGTEDYTVANEGDRIRREQGFKQQVKGPINPDWIDGTEGSYSRIEGGNGSKTQELFGRYQYQYRLGSWYWETTTSEHKTDSGTVSSHEEIPNGYTSTNFGVKYIYTYSYSTRRVKDGYWKDDISERYEDENGNWIEPEWIDTSYDVYDWTEYTEVQTLTINWSAWQPEETKEMKITFYPRPKEFTFDNCASGNKWRIDKGINASAEDGGLIHNLTDFQSYANQWQAWKNQRSYTSTPSFDSPLSASRINSIYESLGGSGGYTSGDRIKAEMFNNLAEIING